MSDTGRESFTDKASRNVKPDNEKTYTERFTDAAKDKSDSIMSSMQPEGEKSYTQKAGDALSGNNTESSCNNDESILGKAKNAMGMGNKGNN